MGKGPWLCHHRVGGGIPGGMKRPSLDAAGAEQSQAEVTEAGFSLQLVVCLWFCSCRGELGQSITGVYPKERG